MKMLLRNLNAEVGSTDILKPTSGNEGLQEISNDNGVRGVNFPAPKNLTVDTHHITITINMHSRSHGKTLSQI
jgi:hypothetical protein